MSKIQINQLNTSELNELNSNEMANVVGGKKSRGGSVRNTTINRRKTVVNFKVNQNNYDDDLFQVTILTGGAKKGGNSGVGVGIEDNDVQKNYVSLGGFSIG
ncbi:MAG: hypothetical protein Tsb0014_15400 [Pleurocapsa sp.]